MKTLEREWDDFLSAEFCPQRGQAVFGISNDAGIWFNGVLLGEPFLSICGKENTGS